MILGKTEWLQENLDNGATSSLLKIVRKLYAKRDYLRQGGSNVYTNKITQLSL